jgi:hypothetical protein
VLPTIDETEKFTTRMLVNEDEDPDEKKEGTLTLSLPSSSRLTNVALLMLVGCTIYRGGFITNGIKSN